MHVRALDGLRGLAVLGVLAFHAEADWARGGFLGVSLFFTLSGFLITGLLLAEGHATHRVALGAFWARRARRLLPAALATVALVVVLVGLAGDDAARRDLPGDVAATTGYVANWHQLAAGQSYGELFEAPSPLLHTWSLSIEEQAYVVLPLLVVGAGAVGAGAGATGAAGARRAVRRRVAAVLGALAVASVGIGALGLVGGDRAYYGTDARAAELLLGALLACALAGRRLDDPFRCAATGRLLRVAGPVALVAVLLSWGLVDQRSAWLARGGLAAHALVACVVIAAALVPGAPLTRALGSRPLVAAGLVSYGLYLYHWPLFWWLSPERTGLDGPALLTVRLVATASLALASYRWLEQPIRAGWRPRPPVATLAIGTTAVLVLAALAVPTLRAVPPGAGALDAAPGTLLSSTHEPATTDAPDHDDRELTGGPGGAPLLPGAAYDPARREAVLARRAILAGAAQGPSPTGVPAAAFDPAHHQALMAWQPTVTAAVRPLRVLVLGDSTAWYLTLALGRWGRDTGAMTVTGHARLGCGILRTDHRTHLGHRDDPPPACLDWPTEWPAAIAETRPDVVVVASGWWEAVDSDPLGPGDDLLAPGDPDLDAAVVADWGLAADLVHEAGVPVVWLDLPPVTGDPDEPRPHGNAVSHPERIDRLNELLDDVAADRPWLTVLPYRQLYQGWPAGPFDPDLRPDGLHVDGEAGWQAVGDWLGPRIVEATSPQASTDDP